MVRRWVAVTAGMLIAIAACVAPAASTVSPSPDTTVEPSAALLPSPRPAQTTPHSSIPADLIGTWEADLGEFYGDDVCLECGTEATLTISEDGTYRLVRGTTTTSGPLARDGEAIVFLGNRLCPGVGAYHWIVDGNELVMTAAGQDECVRRAEALNGPTFLRRATSG